MSRLRPVMTEALSLLWTFLSFIVLGLLSVFFYEVGWWPLGAFTRMVSALALIGLILMVIQMLIRALSSAFRNNG